MLPHRKSEGLFTKTANYTFVNCYSSKIENFFAYKEVFKRFNFRLKNGKDIKWLQKSHSNFVSS